MPNCTCHCPEHPRARGLTTPLTVEVPPDPPALVKAKSALERATKREVQAHEAWSTVEQSRRQLETTLMIRWRNHPGGLQSAPPADLDELERLRKRSQELFDNLRALGAETVEARGLAAAEQHKAIQLMIASW